tara:strand:+ start:3167 stop:3601 length:435 start_codon:yes stop_codon:yes gene_type:complete
MIKFYTKLAVIFILVCVFVFIIFFTKCKGKEGFNTTTTAAPTPKVVPTTKDVPTEVCLTNSVNNDNNFISNCITYEKSNPIREEWFKIPDGYPKSSTDYSSDQNAAKLEKLNMSPNISCAINSIECQFTNKYKENCDHCIKNNN